jgi:hypothetical protein
MQVSSDRTEPTINDKTNMPHDWTQQKYISSPEKLQELPVDMELNVQHSWLIQSPSSVPV